MTIHTTYSDSQTDAGMGASCLALDGFELNLPLATASTEQPSSDLWDDDFEEDIAILAHHSSNAYQ